jgi:hypothetical protein
LSEIDFLFGNSVQRDVSKSLELSSKSYIYGAISLTLSRVHLFGFFNPKEGGEEDL